jgi:hypothetical protein
MNFTADYGDGDTRDATKLPRSRKKKSESLAGDSLV